MNQIHYFKHKDGFSWGAVAPGQFEESVIIWGSDQHGEAEIQLNRGSKASLSYYQRSDSSYRSCSREDYLTARGHAQAAIARYLGVFLLVQNPATVDLGQDFAAQVQEFSLLATVSNS